MTTLPEPESGPDVAATPTPDTAVPGGSDTVASVPAAPGAGIVWPATRAPDLVTAPTEQPAAHQHATPRQRPVWPWLLVILVVGLLVLCLVLLVSVGANHDADYGAAEPGALTAQS